MKKICVSGYFIWLHSGHIEYFKKASKYGEVICIVNNDIQQKLKYGRIIVPLKERIEVLRAIKYITKVVPSIDKDRTVCKTLAKIKPDLFGKGGDRFSYEIPETPICNKLNIKIIDGLGKKIQSSSKLLETYETK